MVEIPKQYKDGFVEFIGCKIDLSKKPLIPRIETGYWVNHAISDIKDRNKPSCLDLFSGSGCVGVAILKNTESAYCDFGEIEDRFIEQIKINTKQNNIDQKRFLTIKTDIFSGISKTYDFILANPPYVAESRINDVGEDVLLYEPKIALFSGEKGMNIIEIFLLEAKKYLNNNGVIYLEFDQEQQLWIEDILKNENYSKWDFFKDQFGLIRFVKIIK